MIDLKKILGDFYTRYSAHNFLARRASLIEEMSELGKENVNCHSCHGKCCTFSRNSMQIDPLQAIELLHYLVNSGDWSADLKEKLEENIKKYRLDHIIDLGRGRILRRYYTCPFFVGGDRGCSVSRKFKPYGCLGFNPTLENVTDGEGCHSMESKLEKREDIFSGLEEELNLFLTDRYTLSFSSLPIPVALLEIAQRLDL